MNKKQVEKKINGGFTNAAPDVYDSISQDCRGVYGQTATSARPAQRKIMPWRIATFALAFILVAAAILGGIGLHGEYASAATVSLDVNPSVEIKINNKQRVISAEGLNDEGKDILGTMDLKGCQLEVAVNAVIGSMLRKGYLSDLANSVLVSVDSSKDLYDQLVERITGEISLTMKDKNIEASVVAQWIKSDDAVSALAKKYDISQGKAQLIHKIAQSSSLYSEEELVALSVNDLSLILGNININDDDLTHSGSASDKTYVGADEALKIALAKLGMEGLTAESEGLIVKESKLDYEDGLMAYEIEFSYGAFEYEVTVGAFSGKVLSFECSVRGGYNPDADGEKLSETEIVEAALQHAKVAESDLSAVAESAACLRSGYYRIEVYTVFFDYGNYFYEYEIDCYGNVLYYGCLSTGDNDADRLLQRREVENYVKQHVHEYVGAIGQVSALNTLERLRVTTKDSDGKIVYQVTFVNKGVEYVCNVDAATKVITLLESNDYEDIVNDAIRDKFDDDFDDRYMDWDEIWNDDRWENDKPHFGGHPAPPQPGNMTETEVKEIVFWLLDVHDENGVTDWECSLEEGKNGMDVYEVGFVFDGVEYELKINAVTGAVMRVDYDYVA
ncbi:MAG: PepSY domain-containing protein [Corallococcus sp.]|nr:PepSY domain-containing protein [Corallococcus sp.]MCM1359788.1 PepSY domain-containing protein [Corallococcus sp.]MCM1395686.1 PepSY domain-containing protein [Corallococcus sp.]